MSRLKYEISKSEKLENKFFAPTSTYIRTKVTTQNNTPLGSRNKAREPKRLHERPNRQQEMRNRNETDAQRTAEFILNPEGENITNGKT